MRRLDFAAILAAFVLVAPMGASAQSARPRLASADTVVTSYLGTWKIDGGNPNCIRGKGAYPGTFTWKKVENGPGGRTLIGTYHFDCSGNEGEFAQYGTPKALLVNGGLLIEFNTVQYTLSYNKASDQLVGKIAGRDGEWPVTLRRQ